MLGVLGQATLKFVAVATLLFFFFCECPKFCDLAKQRRKNVWGVSKVGRINYAPYFFWLCVFFLVFHFLLLQSRDERCRGVTASWASPLAHTCRHVPYKVQGMHLAL